MKRPLFVVCFLMTACSLSMEFFAFPSPAWGEGSSAAESVALAAEQYANGDFAEAADSYHKLLESGVVNGYLYYNLANAQFRLEDYGKAIANYRLALLYLPGDADVLANLSLARKRVVDRIGQSEPASSVESLPSAPFFRVNDFQLKLGLLISYGLLFLGVAVQPLGGSRRKTIRRAQSVLLVLVILFGAILFGTREGRLGTRVLALTPSAHSITPAVITEEQVEVRSGDGESFQVVFLLHEGAEIEIAERRGNWAEVLLPRGRHGWLPVDSLAIIEQ